MKSAIKYLTLISSIIFILVINLVIFTIPYLIAVIAIVNSWPNTDYILDNQGRWHDFALVLGAINLLGFGWLYFYYSNKKGKLTGSESNSVKK